MDLDLSDDQHELEQSARDLLDRERTVELARRVAEEDEGAGRAVDDLWDTIVGLDWPALTVPDSVGGLGLGAVELAVVSEQLGYALAPGPFLPTASQFVTAVREAGTEDQKRMFLQPVAVEGAPGTLAIAEPTGSFDPRRVRTTFRRVADGFVLNGKKAFVLEASRAREIVVVARSEGSEGASGIAMFVVAAGTPGMELLAMPSLDPTREVADIELSSVHVGPERALEVTAGAKALARVLEEATVAISAEMVGTCQRIFDVLLEHAKTREQFGVKIGSFQAMKHKFANMYVAVESARATVRFAAVAIAENDPRRGLAVSMAKSAVGDCERLLGVEGIQCLGGIGYTWEHDMHLYVKRVRSASALFGTASQHRAKVADMIGL